MTELKPLGKRPLIILGIDPGSRVAGFALIEFHQNGTIRPLQHGVIKLNASAALEQRLLELSDDLKQLFEHYKPDQVAVEKVFLGKNVDSAFTLGHARGVVLLEAARINAKVYEYATRSVKKGITGNGGAEKEVVQNCLRKMLGLDELGMTLKQLDASDALALAVYHASQIQVFRLQEGLL